MTAQEPAPYRLSLLGPWDLRGPDGGKVRSVLSQPKRLCLLAYLTLAPGPVARSTLVALFWPESDEERARNALSQSLHYLRRSLGPGVVESVEGDRVRVATEKVWLDARELLEEGEASAEVLGAARRIREGRELFQGYNADDNRPLQEWLDGVRRRVRERAAVVVASTATVEPPDDGLSGVTQDDGPGDLFPEGTEDSTSGGAAPEVRTIRRWTLVGGGALLGIVLGLLFLRTAVGNSTPPSETAPGATSELPEVAVLLPRVTLLSDGGDYTAQALAQAVHDELVVLLGGAETVRPVFISFESEVWQLVRSLEAQGSSRMPDWVLTISIRSAGGEARVVGLLLRGPDYTEAEVTHVGDYRVPSGPEAILDLPRTIAEGVAARLQSIQPRKRP